MYIRVERANSAAIILDASVDLLAHGRRHLTFTSLFDSSSGNDVSILVRAINFQRK